MSTALMLSTALVFGLAGTVATYGTAFAQTHDDGGGGNGLQLRVGPGGGGHDDTSHESGTHDEGEGSHESDGGRGGQHEPQSGGQAGRAEDGRGNGGGQPVWSREGIPEVELGRLNVARSPDRVLERALEEAKASFSTEIADFYRQNLDQMVATLSLDWANAQFIDSPLQNLALLKDSLDGTSVLRDAGVMTDTHVLQAVFLGTASDKEMPISTDTAIAIATILGHPISPAEAETLARDAERIRIAILAGHG
jgi:hypothetical protein